MQLSTHFFYMELLSGETLEKHNTRYAKDSNFYVKGVRTTQFGLKNLQIEGSMLWPGIPNNIKNSQVRNHSIKVTKIIWLIHINKIINFILLLLFIIISISIVNMYEYCIKFAKRFTN